LSRIIPAGLRVDLEAEELQIILVDKRRNFGQGQAMLLDVKQQIAAFAETEEIRV